MPTRLAMRNLSVQMRLPMLVPTTNLPHTLTTSSEGTWRSQQIWKMSTWERQYIYSITWGSKEEGWRVWVHVCFWVKVGKPGGGLWLQNRKSSTPEQIRWNLTIRVRIQPYRATSTLKVTVADLLDEIPCREIKVLWTRRREEEPISWPKIRCHPDHWKPSADFNSS